VDDGEPGPQAVTGLTRAVPETGVNGMITVLNAPLVEEGDEK
jgi:hypothetical protein